MNNITQKFLSASADLLQEAIAAARAEDPHGVQGLAEILRAGGLVTLIATLAPSTGLAQINVEISEPNGATHQLSRCELTREVVQ